MRSDLQEPGAGVLASTKTSGDLVNALQPSVVDAVLSDEAAPIVPQRGSRREIRSSASFDAAHMAIDERHPAASPNRTDASDGALFRQLSRQLSLLEVQQLQIRRLLEQTERRSGRTAAGESLA
jgi:hypothetical protein